MGSLSASHWLIIALVVLVLFGSTKLPTFARSIGRSMRIFKSETKGLRGDDDDGEGAEGGESAEGDDGGNVGGTDAEEPAQAQIDQGSRESAADSATAQDKAQRPLN